MAWLIAGKHFSRGRQEDIHTASAKREAEGIQICFKLYKAISFKRQLNETAFLGVQSYRGEQNMKERVWDSLKAWVSL